MKRPSPVVLITRPEASALPLKEELEAKGYATMIEPLLTIRSLGNMAALPRGVQAIALTSAHAVPALSEEAKRFPVFTVGKATGKAARAAGCKHVIEGDGDGADLAVRIGKECRPEDGAILHIAGEVVREDLSRILRAQGFDMRHEAVYQALANSKFSDDLVRAWEHRDIAAVLLFSPRTADILVRLLIEHGLTSQVDRTAAICVSEEAATPCRELVWEEVCLAPRPNQAAMIRALEGSIIIC